MTVPAPGAPAAGGAGGSPPAAGTGGPSAGGATDSAPPAPVHGAEGSGTPPGEQPDGAAAQPEAPQSGPGAESFEATGRMGQGSLRHGHLQNAVANVEGDIVGGDKYVLLLGGTKKRLRTLSPLIEERVRFAYHPPLCFSVASEALRKQNLLILRGAHGYGKSALAVRLLMGACQGGPVYHLDSDVDFASLAEQLESGSGGIERGVGFLLDHPADIGNLDREGFEKVQGALSRAGAWMVLTVASTEVSDSELLGGVLDVSEEPDQHAVVRAHVRWRLGERAAGRLLARPDVYDLLAELLAGEPACRQAAELAAALCEEYESGELSAERLRERRARTEAEDFEIWAESLPDLAARSLALALAVLNGLPQEYVARAARALRDRLEDDAPYIRAAGADGRLPQPRNLFAVPRRRQLTLLRARAVPKSQGEPGEVLEYKDPDYPRMVIKHAWTQYEIQDELLDWLGQLVMDPSEEVRVYAAAGLGVLAADSFGYVSGRILNRWAYSDSAYRRAAVAYALSVGCRDDWVREQAAAMVETWLGDRSRPLGQATAARVHGLGAVTDRPVEEIGRLAVVGNVTVAVAVGCSLADLLADDFELTAAVLNMLHEQAADYRARPTALLSFLILAAQLVIDTEERSVGGQVPDRPALLYLAHRRPELQEPFIRLWRAALNQAFFDDEAEQVMRNWAALAERDPELREMFRLMIGAIAYGDERSGRILRRCADEWTHPDNLAPLPLAASTVHAQLDLEKVLSDRLADSQ
ncbi:hypothetical protein ACFO9E_14375 [Streptomyces maoxianensis]|uniref:Uncharacterized protein n=1 Tax=Streptomyces maoxianensis TaxID=1459942 RepID=A0ABV9G7S3_9ACTN